MDKKFRPAIRIPGQFNRNDSEQADRSAFANPQSSIVEYNPQTYWEDIRMSAATGKVNVTPAWEKISDNGAGSSGLYAWAMHKTTENDLWFACQIPHSYKEGSDIYPHIHWCNNLPGSGTTYVRWGLEYVWVNATDDVIPDSTILYVDQVASTIPKAMEIASFDKIVGFGKTISSMLLIRVFRDASVDNYDSEAYFLEVDIHYERNTPGSIGMLQKDLV